MFNKFLKLPTEQKVLLILAVIVILVGLLYHSNNYPQLYARAGAGVGRMRGSINLEAFDEKCKVVLYHMTGCPHCVNLMPEWEKFTKMNRDKYNIEKKERSEMTKDELNTVSGFPTIKVVPSNRPEVVYDGDRTSEALAAFVEKTCAMQK